MRRSWRAGSRDWRRSWGERRRSAEGPPRGGEAFGVPEAEDLVGVDGEDFAGCAGFLGDESPVADLRMPPGVLGWERRGDQAQRILASNLACGSLDGEVVFAAGRSDGDGRIVRKIARLPGRAAGVESQPVIDPYAKNRDDVRRGIRAYRGDQVRLGTHDLAKRAGPVQVKAGHRTVGVQVVAFDASHGSSSPFLRAVSRARMIRIGAHSRVVVQSIESRSVRGAQAPRNWRMDAPRLTSGSVCGSRTGLVAEPCRPRATLR